MRLFLTIILLLFFSFSHSQNFSYPKSIKEGQTITDFIPAGWSLLDSAFGDLNGDKVKDAAIVLQHADSVSITKEEDAEAVVTQPRMLLILFKNPSNNFYAATQNNHFILNHDNPAMDDPYKGLTIDKGVLQIDFQLIYTMGSWYTTRSSYKFRYENNGFLLIGADLFSIHRATLDYEAYSYNFLTKKRSFTKGNDQKRTKKTTWTSLPLPAPKTLETFTAPFTWEVEKDVYL